jgi:phosphatidylglycerophosphatase A
MNFGTYNSGDEDGFFYAGAAVKSSGMRRAWREHPISTFFATGCGIGMIPFAPGTWGSLEGLAGALLLWGYLDGMHFLGGGLIVHYSLTDTAILIAYGSVAGVVFLIGVGSSSLVERTAGIKDPGPIVIDEVAGQILASSVVPCLRWYGHGWTFWILSFLLFRLFDIWKPGPINRLQDLPGGWGIMMDDVAAGILAGVLTYGIGRFV